MVAIITVKFWRLWSVVFWTPQETFYKNMVWSLVGIKKRDVLKGQIKAFPEFPVLLSTLWASSWSPEMARPDSFDYYHWQLLSPDIFHE